MFEKNLAASSAAVKTNDVIREHQVKSVYTGKELLDMEIEDVPKLWEPGLLKTGISILAGSSDCGKSTLTRQLAMAICKKEITFLGTKLNVNYGKSLVICTEDDAEVVAACLYRQMKSEKDKAYAENMTFMFDSENLFREVNKAFKTSKYDLVLVDNWTDTFTGNTNDLSTCRHALHPWRELARINQCHVMLLHHTIKHSDKVAPDKNRLNGSQGIEAKTRTLIELRQGNSKNERMLTYLKSNNMSADEKQNSVILYFDETSLTFSNSGKKVNKNQLGYSFNKVYTESDAIKKASQELRSEGITYPKIREKMVEKYGEDNVPKLTWFKDNCN